MNDIEELQSRIMGAMERVAQGLNELGTSGADEIEKLSQELDQEKQVNAQLTERVRVIGERQEQALAILEAKAEDAAARMTALDTHLQQLRKANGLLSEACDAMRAANAEGVGDPDLINKSLAAELEAIRAMRSAERAEADEIISTLMPLLNASAPRANEEIH